MNVSHMWHGTEDKRQSCFWRIVVQKEVHLEGVRKSRENTSLAISCSAMMTDRLRTGQQPLIGSHERAMKQLHIAHHLPHFLRLALFNRALVLISVSSQGVLTLC